MYKFTFVSYNIKEETRMKIMVEKHICDICGKEVTTDKRYSITFEVYKVVSIMQYFKIVVTRDFMVV